MKILKEAKEDQVFCTIYLNPYYLSSHPLTEEKETPGEDEGKEDEKDEEVAHMDLITIKNY